MKASRALNFSNLINPQIKTFRNPILRVTFESNKRDKKALTILRHPTQEFLKGPGENFLVLREST